MISPVSAMRCFSLSHPPSLFSSRPDAAVIFGKLDPDGAEAFDAEQRPLHLFEVVEKAHLVEIERRGLTMFAAVRLLGTGRHP